MKKILILGLAFLIGFSGVSAFAGSSYDLLIKAIQERDVGKAKKALEEGADVNLQDEFGMSALMRTVGFTGGKGGSVEMAKLLIASGADVKAKDESGDTMLMWAASGNSV